ncbi:MAG: O-antigen ligase family protein, partial [Bacteroidia bacterium]|nr:O-antigen ligase family protein [Bacteroidia bacterium]
ILDKVAVPFLAVVIILLSSKMALIILTLGTLIYFFGFKGWGFLRNLKILILVLASLVAVVFISRQMTNRFLEEKRSNIEEILKKKQFGRIYLWTGTTIRVFHLRLLKEQMEDDKIFWNGYGVFASRIDLKERHKKYDTYKGFHDYNYHNQYAQIMAELGIAGLLFLIGMLILMARSGIARSDYFTLVFALMMIFIFTSESFLWVQRGLVFFMIFYGLLARLDIAPKKTTFKAKNLLKS